MKYIFHEGGYMGNILPKKMNIAETKRDRFVRIAERRVNKIFRRNYQYTDSDVRKIFGEIEKKLREIKVLYRSTANNKNRFKLKS
jgi:hypothetical protein